MRALCERAKRVCCYCQATTWSAPFTQMVSILCLASLLPMSQYSQRPSLPSCTSCAALLSAKAMYSFGGSALASFPPRHSQTVHAPPTLLSLHLARRPRKQCILSLGCLYRLSVSLCLRCTCTAFFSAKAMYSFAGLIAFLARPAGVNLRFTTRCVRAVALCCWVGTKAMYSFGRLVPSPPCCPILLTVAA